MKHKFNLKPHQALIMLNAVLLGVLGLVALEPGATAQSARSRGQYLMVGGKSVVNQPGVAYILDQSNQELICVSWNDSAKSLAGVGYQNISRVIESGQKTR